MTKNNKGLFTIYDGCTKSGEYFNFGHLPDYNGEPVESIWCPCDFTKDPKFVDAPGWRFKSGNCFIDDHERYKEINQFGYLPEEWKYLFGFQTINGKKQFVRHISFRTSSSGHASWDSIMSIYVDDDTLSIYYDRTGKEKGLNQNDPYVQKWLKHFKTNVPYVHPKKPYWKFKRQFPKLHENDGTYIQWVNGDVFPDVYCKPWRKYGTHAYRKFDDGRLTFINEETREKYLLNKHIPQAGETNLIYINPSSFGLYYLFPLQNSMNGDILRVEVESIGKKYIHVIVNDKKDQWDINKLNYFYSIFSITKF